jgi:eukaryotic-like serine/threonine-protein kinase
MIANRYRLLHPLGSGSSATVWAATDETLGRQVALKLLSLSGAAADSARERERLRREAKALAALAHPRIVAVFDLLETETADGGWQSVLVTELLEGESLAARLEGGPLPWPEALSVCGQVADALAAAHEVGIVHRDVTPSNVLLTAKGAKLLDFGIAQGPADRGPTGGLAVGTPVCMAPEQLTGRGAVPASDVYALGCLMYWSLTGHPPFRENDFVVVSRSHVHAAPPQLEVDGLPSGINEFYLTCMEKNPTKRPFAEEASELLAPFAREAVESRGTNAATRFLPAIRDVPEADADEPRSPTRHAGRSAALDRRRLLPAGLLLLAAALIIVRIVGLVHANDGSSAAPKSPFPLASTNAVTTGASPTSTMASVVLPSASASATMSASPSQSPSPMMSATMDPSMGAIPPLPDPAADPVAYVQGISNQVSALVAQGPAVMQPGAGQNLQAALGNLANAIASARGQSNPGMAKKQWHVVSADISGVEQQIAGDANAGQVSPGAANLLTGELQRLAGQIPNGSAQE